MNVLSEARDPSGEEEKGAIEDQSPGQVPEHQGPNTVVEVGEAQRDQGRSGAAEGIGERPVAQVDRLGEEAVGHHAERVQQKGQAEHAEGPGEAWIGVQIRDRPRGHERHRGQQKAGGGDDPEDRVDLLARHRLTLHDRGTEAELLQ
jgi:hypothetical protein